jgi:hypothetical protein
MEKIIGKVIDFDGEEREVLSVLFDYKKSKWFSIYNTL